jgi:hypothetical protein
MNKEMIDSTEVLLAQSLRNLFVTLGNKDASKGAKIRAVLDFHFTQTEQVKYFLEDLGVEKE